MAQEIKKKRNRISEELINAVLLEDEQEIRKLNPGFAEPTLKTWKSFAKSFKTNPTEAVKKYTHMPDYVKTMIADFVQLNPDYISTTNILKSGIKRTVVSRASHSRFSLTKMGAKIPIVETVPTPIIETNAIVEDGTENKSPEQVINIDYKSVLDTLRKTVDSIFLILERLNNEDKNS